MRKNNTYILISALSVALLSVPLLMSPLYAMPEKQSDLVTSNIQSNYDNYNTTFNNKTYEFAPTKGYTLPKSDFGSNDRTGSIPNAMQQVFSFKGVDNILYNVISNPDGGIIVMGASGNKKGQVINILSPQYLLSSNSKGGTDDGLIPLVISDVVPSSNGQYLYLSAVYANPKDTHPGDTRTCEIFKYDYLMGMVTPLYNTSYTPLAPGNGITLKATTNIACIPTSSGDKLMLFNDYVDIYEHGGGSALTTDVIIDANQFSKSLLSYEVVPIGAFTGNLSGAARWVEVDDAFVSEISNNNYKLVTSTRSRDASKTAGSSVYANSIGFSLNSDNTIKWDVPTKGSTGPTYRGSASQMSGIHTNLNYDWFNFEKAYPLKIANIWYSLSSSYGLQGDSFLHEMSTTTPIKSIDSFSDTSVTNISIDDVLRTIESDISLNGKITYKLLEKSRKIYDSKGDNISLDVAINKDYLLPFSHATIIGFGWADQAKSKMLIYDTNNEVLQYDLVTDSMSLISGIAFKNANLGSAKYKKPSELSNDDLKSLFITPNLYDKGKDKMKVSKSNVDDSNNSFTLNVEITKGNKNVYSAKQDFTNFNQTKPKSNGFFSSTTSWIIIGSAIGALVIVIIVIISSVYVVKKKINRDGD